MALNDWKQDQPSLFWQDAQHVANPKEEVLPKGQMKDFGRIIFQKNSSVCQIS